MNRPALILAASLAVFAGAAAKAHHSFAVYFDGEKIITLKGTVKSFRFTNPHGLIVLEVTDDEGKRVEWRSETNAPVVLMRRGWRRDSVKPGETITIDGWPARDGKPYLRLRSARKADGKMIGTTLFDETDG